MHIIKVMFGSIALMKRKRIIQALLCILVFLSYPVFGARGGGGLSHGEKKNAVYRMYSGYKVKFPTVSDITVEETLELIKSGRVVLVDIRKPDEMSVSMLPDAVVETDFENNPERYGGLTVVAYCTIGYRSGLFAAKMGKMGMDVLNLKGGILAWILEGGRVYAPGGVAVNRVHVYGKKWDLAPAGFESVMF